MRKIVVIGGTGLIGSRLVAKLRDAGHQPIAAAPPAVNAITGEGLAAAMTGADVVVDVTNSPSLADDAILEFFRTSTRNLLAAEGANGVVHHVALSVVGTERLSASGYFRGKMAQEELISAGSIPYSIVRATQFFEFVKGIADAATNGNTVTVSPAMIQPIAAADVADAVGRVALGRPIDGIVEVAGPERFQLDALIRKWLAARGDTRQVAADREARYFGARLEDGTLLPSAAATLATTRFDDWLKSNGAHGA